MKPSSLAASLLLLASSDLILASRFGIYGRPRSKQPSGELARRASIVGNTSISNVGDVEYLTDITLGGKKFSVQIDTGSSDLWVAGDVPNAQDTGKTAKVTYAVGGVSGSVKTAELDFAGYTVDNQAYISVAVSSDNKEGSGLIGLGPNYGSQVSDAVGDSSGDAVLDRIFQQNTSTPNYITFLLGRNDDPTDPPTGDLTVGELMSGYENVTSQPKLSVSVVSSTETVNQHWQILLDADGIVGPAGNDVISEFNVESAVDSTSNKKQLTVVLDTGYSLPQVPTAVAEALYKDVPDAQLVTRSELSGQVWQLPCDKEVNITFKFGGVSFPVHPLDSNIDLNLTDSSGNHVCFGAFQPFDPGEDATYDAIFGMAFLRNAYTYINFGDFVEGTKTTADPYVQMLPLSTDLAESHSDFLKVRGNSPWTPEDASIGDRLKAHLPLVIGVSVGAGVLILAAIAGLCYRSRKSRRTPFFQQRYQPLHEPAPEAYTLGAVPDQSGRAYHPAYNNPWDARY
ncbi:acid protease [Lentinus tigrinus ALCF2SS1-7]|uniref:Acid protease n=1 Tax=Lentinus tigrinus ALCF2SS1-6 TaxID=1328759 RepID=A0A5C2SHH8_9APHY|nr:acid protease [Lentinus tigrinus ALCF2SS1-6]RPD77518.1 acid protease [Lentinus tigrinus ALCF2SS1-7]